MPRGIGYYDLTPYLQELLTKLQDIPLEYLSDEIKKLLNNPNGITLEQLSPELQILVQTAMNVGYNNLDAYLQSKIDDIGKFSGDTIYISNNNIYKGTREIYEDTYDVNFICGDIKEYTMFKDTLNVYLNSVRLAEGVDYVVNEDRESIHSLRDTGWRVNKEGTLYNNRETYNLFEFEIYKNSTVETAGQGIIKNEYLQDGSITIDKFTPEVKELIYNNVSLIKNNVYFGYKEIVIDTALVNFICGEIQDFKDGYDVIEVFLNGVRLTRGVNYEINDERTIRCLEGYWTITEGETYNFFEFVVEKNVSAQFNPESSQIIDTENLVDGSITIDKLSPDLWALIDDKKMLMQVTGGQAILTDETLESASYRIGNIRALDESSNMSVYVNSVRLMKDIDYVIDEETETIIFDTPYHGSDSDPVYIEIQVITSSTDRTLISELQNNVTYLTNQYNKLNDSFLIYKSNMEQRISELEETIDSLISTGVESVKSDLDNYKELTDPRIDNLEQDIEEIDTYHSDVEARLLALEDSVEMEQA